jgi:hypothetical protein
MLNQLPDCFVDFLTLDSFFTFRLVCHHWHDLSCRWRQACPFSKRINRALDDIHPELLGKIRTHNLSLSGSFLIHVLIGATWSYGDVDLFHGCRSSNCRDCDEMKAWLRQLGTLHKEPPRYVRGDPDRGDPDRGDPDPKEVPLIEKECLDFSVTHIRSMDESIRYQLISLRTEVTYHVLNFFDMSICQNTYNGTRLDIFSASSFRNWVTSFRYIGFKNIAPWIRDNMPSVRNWEQKARKNDQTRFFSYYRLDSILNRVFKYLDRGFSISHECNGSQDSKDFQKRFRTKEEFLKWSLQYYDMDKFQDYTAITPKKRKSSSKSRTRRVRITART